jgi:chemotaxis protein methyltransferase CheR
MALSELQCRRLEERLAARPGDMSVTQYLRYLQTSMGAAELAELVETLTVQKTDLFRDEAQLQALRSHVLEPLVARMRRPLRVWSAGCATGEEVATLLMLLAESGADPMSTVLGTDISGAAIARARELTFSTEQLQRVPTVLRERYFLPLPGGRFVLAGWLRDRASFACHNLMDTPYPRAAEGQGFDVIVCRNVLIYFTPEAFDRVVVSLAERLAPEGTLLLSAAEPLLSTPPSLRTLRHDQAFFYVRAQEGTAPRELPPLPPVKTPSATGLPAVGPRQTTESGRFLAVTGRSGTDSGRFPAIGASSSPEELSEADALFARILEGATGQEPPPQTGESLRRCLALDPNLAAARYLLGMLLEQQGEVPEALTEYRRALRSLEVGRARATPFFLNNARLQVACSRAIERVEKSLGRQ